MVRSSEAEASRRPSGDQATLLTKLEWPERVWRRWADWASQRRVVRSSEAEASRRPSGDQMIWVIFRVWPRSVRCSLKPGGGGCRSGCKFCAIVRFALVSIVALLWHRRFMCVVSIRPGVCSREEQYYYDE